MWAPRVLDGLRKIPELKDANTDQQTSGLELDVTIDRDSASRLGLTLAAIDDALYDAYGQRQVAISYTASNYYRVVLEVTPDYQKGPDQLDRIFVRSASGAIVPLSAVAKFGTGLMPLGITHQGQFPSVTLSFNLAPGKALGDAIKAIDKLERQIGMPASINAGFNGTAQAFGASLASEPLAHPRGARLRLTSCSASFTRASSTRSRSSRRCRRRAVGALSSARCS